MQTAKGVPMEQSSRDSQALAVAQQAPQQQAAPQIAPDQTAPNPDQSAPSRGAR